MENEFVLYCLCLFLPCKRPECNTFNEHVQFLQDLSPPYLHLAYLRCDVGLEEAAPLHLLSSWCYISVVKKIWLNSVLHFSELSLVVSVVD